MGEEKLGEKASGFFTLFSWNKKSSRKKLFCDGSDEHSDYGKRFDGNIPTTQQRPFTEVESVGITSVKGSGEYSCSSSMTDEEGNGVRSPGVVARLMGLDSMPISSVSEAHSSCICGSQSFRYNCSHRRTPEVCIGDQFNHASDTADGYIRKQMEFRFQNMPSSPIERFQSEGLPPRSAKSIPITHHKLLSPIKNHGFISTRNAAHIVEAAAKILKPEFQSTRVKPRTFGLSSVPLRVHDSKETTAPSQRTSWISESSRRPGESTAPRSLKEQPLNRGWNGSKYTANFRSSLDTGTTNNYGANVKGKAVSVSTQGKVYVQRKEGLSTGSRNSLAQKDDDQRKLKPHSRNQPSTQKNNHERKQLTTNGSGVLRQNNQKQNCLFRKDRSVRKPSMSNLQQGEVPLQVVSSGKKMAANKFSGISKVDYRKESSGNSDPEMEELSLSKKHFPSKTRSIDRDGYYEKIRTVDNTSVNRYGKHVQHNVVADEQTRWSEGNKRNVTDVVSFTFTSPMRKRMPGSQNSSQVVENWDKRNEDISEALSEKNAAYKGNNNISSSELNVIDGVNFSILLEQKLRELTSRVALSYCNTLIDSDAAPSSSCLQESLRTLDPLSTASVELEKFLLNSCEEELGDVCDSCLPTNTDPDYGNNHSHELEGVELAECSSSNVQKEPDDLHTSPISILEATFSSNESSSSSESCGSFDENGVMLRDQSEDSVQMNSISRCPSEAELDLSDSASSALKEMLDEELISAQELEYVKDILSNAGSMVVDQGSTLDPVLFEKLENSERRMSLGGEDKEWRVRRKALFDCTNECLELRQSRYFRAGYRTWAKGSRVPGSWEEVAEGIYREISDWKRMGEWMVDEVVYRDVSNHLGSWADFETEAFEAGVEIENELLNSLVGELVVDFLA